uniref:Peptidase A2 domain-containing protein n=1 Tax=Chlamydomonas chlamydogama TaxID=225041 RepID=A0A7S2QVB2_9CHLO|mmetsp:Transcript_449/g.914  ORF Transcript_449/g.914 Transcript_449/m.914 type:complete len:151 (+) Transcript_449:218-670(+)
MRAGRLDDLMWVQCTLTFTNGTQVTAKLLLDTGAMANVLNVPWAMGVGALDQVSPGTEYRSVDGQLKRSIANVLANVNVGGVAITQEFLCINDPNPHSNGILGMPWARACNVAVDLGSANTITVRHLHRALPQGSPAYRDHARHPGLELH